MIVHVLQNGNWMVQLWLFIVINGNKVCSLDHQTRAYVSAIRRYPPLANFYLLNGHQIVSAQFSRCGNGRAETDVVQRWPPAHRHRFTRVRGTRVRRSYHDFLVGLRLQPHIPWCHHHSGLSGLRLWLSALGHLAAHW